MFSAPPLSDRKLMSINAKIFDLFEDAEELDHLYVKTPYFVEKFFIIFDEYTMSPFKAYFLRNWEMVCKIIY